MKGGREDEGERREVGCLNSEEDWEDCGIGRYIAELEMGGREERTIYADP